MSILEKENIANSIKNISFSQIEKEMSELITIGKNACNESPRSRIENNVVYYFTFSQRLETREKYNVNFFEFVEQIDEFKKKKFITNILHLNLKYICI
jgi:hypothetical protein